MKIIEMYEYTIGKHFLPCLINGDYSGLNDEEVEIIDNFEDQLGDILEKENAYTWNVEYTECYNYSKCELTGMFGEVADVKIVFMK